MRKKIIFLLILFSVPLSTLNETSCFCFNKDQIDISNKTFDDVKWLDVSKGDLLYNEVRTQTGS